MLSRKGVNISFGERDEKIAIVKVRSMIGSNNEADFIDFSLNINLIFKIWLIESALFPDSGWFFGSNLGDMIYINKGVLFCIYANNALL